MIHGLNFRLSIYKNVPAYGGLRLPDTLPGLCHWIPLGDFRLPDPLLAPPQFNLLDPPLRFEAEAEAVKIAPGGSRRGSASRYHITDIRFIYMKISGNIAEKMLSMHI